jgi:predicted acylesterase/phospholipase RssA
MTAKNTNEHAETLKRLAQMMTGPLGLCLSGGGFRATFFHLGVVKLLADIGWLPRVKYVFSVSGGSILAAHMATRWNFYIDDNNGFKQAADDLRGLAQRDVRGRIMRRMLLGRRTLLLANEYDSLLNGVTLGSLPDNPRFYFLSTSLTSGRLHAFHRSGISYVQSSSHGSREGRCIHVAEAQRLPLSLAVAASSAFPPLFPPVSPQMIHAYVPSSGIAKLEYLADGGVFDNLGTSRLHLFLGEEKQKLKGIIVSDASAAFDIEREPGLTYWNFVKRNARAIEIAMQQVAALEIENWQHDEQSTTPLHPIEITTIVGGKDLGGYRPQGTEIQKLIPGIRTDLDFFHTDVLRTLVRHGHEVAACSAALASSDALTASWPALPWDPWSVREPRAGDAEELAQAARKAHKRRLIPWNPRWIGAHKR